ncbi:hypothetical protein RhiirC2_793450 [Rhizophagus irregularis]|uniref:Uncharacterized protein n=1 Tax=Rhizophagus irregularis TaxID=588596 RepID=A0A2N1MFE3_9GLOM|nr:hypothetical protein RhiirC2_793450 [Rhizophagus irregularis]
MGREKGHVSTSGEEDIFLESIRKSVLHQKITIKDIILGCASTSYEIYTSELKRLLRENEELRLWLRQAREEEREVVKKLNEDILRTKKSKIENQKAINTAEKDKEGDHREIPVLFDDQDKDKRDKSRNIFFYDIPKYWKDDDIFRELSKIGKVFSIKIRWYKGDSMVIKKERDRWQLTRDLTSEEMEQCKTNEYEFVKKMMNKDFLLAERAVEESIKQGMMEKILKVTELSDISSNSGRKSRGCDQETKNGVEEELDEDMVTITIHDLEPKYEDLREMWRRYGMGSNREKAEQYMEK